MRKQSYATKIRRFLLKREAVRLKGGKCIQCGWSGNIAGFHFHHPDPTQKEFGISYGYTTNWEKYWNEASKCELMCARCHIIKHADNTDEQFLQDVENYRGRAFEVSTIPWKNQTHVPHVYKKVCPHCETPYESSRRWQRYCSKNCNNQHRRKCPRPSKVNLQNMIAEFPMTRIAEKYGVTDNAVRKWCKVYGI